MIFFTSMGPTFVIPVDHVSMVLPADDLARRIMKCIFYKLYTQ